MVYSLGKDIVGTFSGLGHCYLVLTRRLTHTINKKKGFVWRQLVQAPTGLPYYDSYLSYHNFLMCVLVNFKKLPTLYILTRVQ